MEEREGMEWRHARVARRVAEMASESCGIDVRQLADVVGFSPGEVNCYPGTPSDRCCSLAVFVALQGRLAKGRGHYYFSEMLQKFVQHMQGLCSSTTQEAVIITDSWWAKEFEQWAANVRTISEEGHVEIYLIGFPGWAVPIKL